MFSQYVLFRSSRLYRDVRRIAYQFGVRTSNVKVSSTKVVRRYPSNTIMSVTVADTSGGAIFVVMFRSMIFIFLRVVLFGYLICTKRVRVVSIRRVGTVLQALLLCSPFMTPSNEYCGTHRFKSRLMIVLRSRFYDDPCPPLRVTKCGKGRGP